MDYYLLVDLATRLGCELARSGAETFRVEDTICRILGSYGIEAEVFAIPNCLTISFEAANGKPLTRMHRICSRGNDLEAVEQFNALSRRICAEKPDPQVAMQWFRETKAKCRVYSFPMQMLGCILGSLGFCMFFNGSPSDSIFAGICGLLVGLLQAMMIRLKANLFFRSISGSFVAAVTAYIFAALHLLDNVDTVIIGTMMILVPGMLFTNSMRDIIYGDINSGVVRIVQVCLTAMAIAMGSAAAWNVTASIWGQPFGGALVNYPFLVHCLISLIGCVGFAISFNVHGLGIWLCAIGGFMTWAVYLICIGAGCDVIGSNFWAAVFASAYAEIMARIRKYPAISYLVVSAFPLFPGSGIFYTMRYAVEGQMGMFVNKGLETAGIAGSMAVGILLTTTLVRMFYTWRSMRHPNPGGCGCHR